MKIGILTDSSTGFTKEQLKEMNVRQVNVKAYLGDVELQELAGGQEEYYQTMVDNPDIETSTSTPSPGNFMEVFEEMEKEYDQVIFVGLGSEVSGTYQVGVNAANEIAPDKITCYDSHGLLIKTRMQLVEAVNARAEGKSVEEIIEVMDSVANKTFMYVTLPAIDRLKKSGRLSAGKAAALNLLGARPIIQLNEAKVETVGLGRTYKKALSKVKEMTLDKISSDFDGTIIVGSILNEEAVADLTNFVNENYPNAKLEYVTISPILGAHTGPGTVGIGAYVK